MRFAAFSWRDRVLVVNSVLFCLLGGALVTRYLTEPLPLTVAILGVVFLAFGVYRLVLARREMRKRAGSSE